MKKSELISMLEGVKDDQEIAFIASDSNDNYTVDSVSLNDYYPDDVEIVLQMDEGFSIHFERPETDEDKYLKSMEYVIESIVNGQHAQAKRLFIANKFMFKEFTPQAKELGLSDEDIASFVDRVMDQ